MLLLNGFSKTQFLKNYWQQKPFLSPQSCFSLHPFVDGDDLAGLACEDDVESRIIRGFGLNNEWSCEQGPFSEERFSQLPETNWTLLVQGLDQYSDECRAILDAFDFLPRWRLEDIMASYAPMGGGVGPHFDYYDVFLIQLSGERQWQLGQQCDESSLLQANAEVKLLQQFDTQITHQVKAGDMLYIPAGCAHWGTATTENCITLSVGFRAPSEKEIVSQVFDELLNELSEQNRYRDTTLAIDQHPHKINASVYENVQSMVSSISSERLEQGLLNAFGLLVTEPRYSGFENNDEQWSLSLLTSRLQEQGRLIIEHAPHARFAFSETHLFVNGESFEAREVFSQALCDKTLCKDIAPKELELVVSLFNESLIFIAQ